MDVGSRPFGTDMAKFEESRYAHEMSLAQVMSFVRMRDARLARKPVAGLVTGKGSAHSDPRLEFHQVRKKKTAR
jgi:hypothetical protein